MESIFISKDQMKSEFYRILCKHGFTDLKADQCAEIFAVNSLEGVYSHGVNRFPRFVKNIREGFVKPDADPSLVRRTGSVEQWDGNLGPGPLNAIFATNRVMALSDENCIGLLALSNTNHWMRGGAYGWMAARKGYVFLGWTNTCPNMPAWGATDPRLGNNPFVIAVPYGEEAIVLDFAMSQFSYGKMDSYNNEDKMLPYPGGFNNRGELTDNPGEILETWRALPMGYWKGAGLSLLLDILAAILSGGLPTHKIGNCNSEYRVSQVFIAINIRDLSNYPSINDTVNQVIKNLKSSVPDKNSDGVRYPGESVAKIKETNLKNGIPVNNSIWEKILTL
jgi:3-dehydro-L-gulonate 2-dehydrogenase